MFNYFLNIFRGVFLKKYFLENIKNNKNYSFFNYFLL